MSEKGDVFFHPDLHTHEACIQEIENCQLFVLIIGGRFGGKYKYDAEKSITNAEYEAAVAKKIPVFTFIKKEVFQDHRVYQTNKSNKSLIKKIKFPSIEKQEYALKIFEFIDRVRLSNVNNGFYPFDLSSEIKDNLGRQLAGLMFDFLSKRKRSYDESIVKATLDNLTLINRKTEEIVESILRKVNPGSAEAEILKTDKMIEASRFISHIDSLFEQPLDLDKLIDANPKKMEWYEYVASDEKFQLENDLEFPDELEGKYDHIELWLSLESTHWSVKAIEGFGLSKAIYKAESLYKVFKTTTKNERKKIFEIITANKR